MTATVREYEYEYEYDFSFIVSLMYVSDLLNVTKKV